MCVGAVRAQSPAGDAAARARKIIRRAIETHGHDRFANIEVSFVFRGTRHRMTRRDGRFEYERWAPEGSTTVHEILDNDGYRALANGRSLTLPSRVRTARSSSLNSVVYFASLPFVLQDPAVRAQALASAVIKAKTYDTVEVRFVEEDGGVDHDDVFRYWFERQSGRLRYLAYRFHTGRGGVRFRVATDWPRSDGVTFVQWDNFGVDDKTISLASLPSRWAEGRLPKLSTIRLDEIVVKPASKQ